MRVAIRVLGAWTALSTIAMGAGAIDGCVSPTCTETATCPDPDGGAFDATADQSRPDASADVGQAESSTQGQDQFSEAEADEEMENGDAPSNGDTGGAEAGTGCATCASAAPAGWSGPGLLYDSLYDAGVACPSSYPEPAFTGYSTLAPTPVTCACGCGSFDAGCTPPTITGYTDNSCGDSCNSQQPTPCADICSAGESAAITVQPAPFGSSCPTTASVTSRPVPWTRQGEVCELQGNMFSSTGCDPGSVCFQPPPAGSGFYYPCIWIQGSTSCPGAPYTLPFSYSSVDGFNDTRICSPTGCSCPTSNVSCKIMTASVFNSSSCSGTANVLTVLDGGCNKNLQQSFTVSGATAQVVSTGQCTSTGTATPAGGVDAAVPAWTVCCAQ